MPRNNASCPSIMGIKTIATLVFILCWCLSYSQQLISNVEFLGVKEGLTTEGANTVFVDSYGIVWIGTENGLIRLVNGEMEVFHEFSKNGKLAGHSVTSLFEDKNGNIWIGDRLKGITVYNSKQNTWRIVKELNNFPQLSDKEVVGFVEDENNTIWAAVYPNLLINFFSKDSIIEVYTYNSKKQTAELDFFYGLVHTPNNELLISSTTSGILKFNKKQETFSPYKIKGVDTLIFPGTTEYNRFLINYQNKGILTSTRKAVYYIDSKTRSIKKLTSLKNSLASLCVVDRHGEITVAQLPYIWQFDSTLKLKDFYKINNNELQPNNDARDIKGIQKDREGITWIASQNDLLKIDPRKQYFNTITKNNSNKSLTNSYVRSIAIDTLQHLWVGSRYGNTLDKFDIKNIEGGVSTVNSNAIKILLNNPNLAFNCIFTTKQQGILAGTYEGLFQINNDKVNYLKTLNKKYRGVIQQIWAIHQLADGSFLLGTRFNGIYKLSKDLTKLSPMIVSISSGEKWDKIASVWNFHKDSQNRVWVLSSFGLYKVITVEGNKIQLDKIPQLKNYSVWAWCETNDKQIWVGSVEGGIHCFDGNGKFLKNITMGEGLPSMTVCALISDANNNVWASTPATISKINSKTKQIENYSYNDGVSLSGFNFRTVAKDNKGIIYFGSKKGIIYFNPLELLKKPQFGAPLLLIRKIESDNLLLQELSIFNNEIELNPNQRSILIEPALISYINPDKNTYKYFLEGYDNKWHSVEGSAPKIQYTQLPPGKYKLVIKAINSSGVVAKNNLSIPIFVVPQFWETTWFIVLIIVLALGVVGLFIYLAISKTYLQRKLMTSEIASLRAQMNPHFFFNALNSIQGFIYHQEKRKAADYMASFAKLLRLILENSSKKFIFLSDEITFLEYYLSLEELRFEGVFKYTIKVDSNLNTKELLMPPMLLQPLIENAIKHGLTPLEENLRLIIRFEAYKNSFKCIIKDNGIGRRSSKTDEKHNSKGLLIVKERLELLNKLHNKKFEMEIIDLVNDEGGATGTEVILLF